MIVREIMGLQTSSKSTEVSMVMIVYSLKNDWNGFPRRMSRAEKKKKKPKSDKQVRHLNENGKQWKNKDLKDMIF